MMKTVEAIETDIHEISEAASYSKGNVEAISEDPMMTIQIDEDKIGLHAFVVIDRLGECGASGGMRCVPDVTINEVRMLARLMTYKYTFFGLPHGGGKGGIVLDYDTPLEKKRNIITALGRHLALILQNSAFSPWTDMNFSPQDLEALYRGGGIQVGKLDGESAERTALSTFASVKATAKHLGLSPQRCRIAIEGLGSVGKVLAREIFSWGGRLVAVSNIHGAISNPDGLPITEVLSRLPSKGSQFVLDSGPWRNIQREELFRIETDIMVPCARVGAITDRVAMELQTQAIVPAANGPCTIEAEAILARRKIPLLPDFIVNAGGVLGLIKPEDYFSFFQNDFRNLVARLLQASKERGMPPIDVAREIVFKNYDHDDRLFFREKSLAQKIVAALRSRSLFPSNQKTILAKRKQMLLDRINNIWLS
jgi:glutamate dehydrogenase/leucine dehydrogenase